MSVSLEAFLPSWHEKDRSLIDRAIAAAASPACRLRPETFLPKLPRLPSASYNIKCDGPKSSAYVQLDRAAVAPWISLDSRMWRNAIIIDIDHTDGPELAAELPPAIRPHIIQDPYSGRSAAIFMLRFPVSRGEKSKKAQHYCELAAAHLEQHFITGPDEDNSKKYNANVLRIGSLTKNPWGRLDELERPLDRRKKFPTSGQLWEAWEAAQTGLVWHTFVGAEAVDLNTIRDYFWLLETKVELKKPARVPTAADHESDSYGRNCELFNKVRFWCYATVERSYEVIAARAAEINGELFLEPLPPSEVRDTAKSVARFMAKYEPGKQCNRGVMQLDDKGFTLQEKQHLAASRTARIKADRTLELLRGIVEGWPVDKKMTQQAVATAVNISIKSVKRYWSKVV